MDKLIVYTKIESLQRCIERIAAKTPSDGERLKKDWDLQDIIILNFQRAVQGSVDIAAIDHSLSYRPRRENPLSAGSWL